MWDNYYDEVEYLEKEDNLDKAGNIVYKEPQLIKVRAVSGGEQFIIGKDDSSIKHTKEYHMAFMVKEGDRVDGQLVISAEASRDVFGNFHFCIAKVV